MVWGFHCCQVGVTTDLMDDAEQSLVRRLRKRLGISADATGETCGISGRSIQIAERKEAKGELKVADLAKLAEALGYRLTYQLEKQDGDGAEPLVRTVQASQLTFRNSPTERAELYHRPTASVRQTKGFTNAIGSFDPNDCIAVVFGIRLRLSATYYLFLAELAAAFPDAVDEQRLIEAVWGEGADVPAVHFRMFLSRLRKRIGKYGIGVQQTARRDHRYVLAPPATN